MDVVEAIRSIVPIARIKGMASERCNDGSTVVARELAGGAGYSVLVRLPDGGTRPATEDEIASAGYGCRGQVKTQEGSTLVSAGWLLGF